MPLISKPNYNQIFASQAPEQDKPAVFNNYPLGWGVESRPNNGKPTIKGFNFLQQTSDLKALWILQNGACLPYDSTIEYAEGAPVLKDGVIQYKVGGGFKSRDSVTVPTYNNAPDGVDPVTGVADGAYFNVRSSSDESYVDEYQNVGGVPTPSGKSYPSAHVVEKLEEGYAIKKYLLDNGVDESELDSDYEFLMQRLAQIAVDKGWDAAFVVDASGLTQQEINNALGRGGIVNLGYMWKPSTSIDCRAVLQAAVDITPEGGKLIIPFDIFYSGTVRCKNKNINIECLGTIYVEPNGIGSFIFERDDYLEIAGTQLSSLPIKGSRNLNFSASPPVSNASDYYVSLQSTENEIQRLEPLMWYTKNHTNDVISSDWTLRGDVPLNFTDASKLTVKIIKKGTQVKHSLKIKPTQPPTSSTQYIVYNYVSNVLRDGSLIDLIGNQAPVETFACVFNHCFNVCGRYSGVRGSNVASVDTYAYLNNNSAYLDFERDYYVDADNNAKIGRAYEARHGFKCTFENCLFASIDDHYGHDYTVKNIDVYQGITWAGGSLTIDNCHAEQALVIQRTDAPYCDGTLYVRNSSTKGRLLQMYRINTATTTKNKLWDIIDVEATVYSKNTVNAVIEMTDGWVSDDVYATKFARFKITQFSYVATPLFLCGKTPQDSSFDGSSSFRMFDKLELDLKIVNMGAISSNTLYGVAARTSINIDSNETAINYTQLRSPILNLNKVKHGYTGDSSATVLSVNTVNAEKCIFDAESNVFSYNSGYNPYYNLDKCRFISEADAVRIINYGRINTAFNTLFDDYTKVPTLGNYEWSAYNRNRSFSYTFPSDLVVPANGLSSVITVPAPSYNSPNHIIATFNQFVDGVDVVISKDAATTGTIRFRVRNSQSTDKTVTSGRVLNFKTFS